VLLREKRWVNPSGLIEWTLHHGDFLAHLENSPAPDLIFYDPFSAKTDTGLWTAEVFGRIHRHTGQRPAELYTYSAATSVRVALLRAGFYVGEGVGTGPKASTTVGFSRIDESSAPQHPARLLGAEWLGRWSRSHSKYPPDLPEGNRPVFDRLITQHPQFIATFGK
jgi:queuine tRNA-ribosyltransferase